MNKKPRDDARVVEVTRRTLFRFGVAVPATTPFLFGATDALPASPGPWPEYLIRRERDELFLRLTAVGYVEAGRRLAPASKTAQLYLVFTFPPQHFAEKALKLKEIPQMLDEGDVRGIELVASSSSRVVFRVPHRRQLRVVLDELLDWKNFELVLPDLEKLGQPYDLEVSDGSLGMSTKIEMPWGIDLAPVSSTTAGSQFGFTDPLRIRAAGAWTEMWTTALTELSENREPKPLSLEVVSVKGFDKISSTGSVEQGNLVVTYRDRPGQSFPSEPTPINNYDRIDIAASLSRRFPYTGKVGPPPTQSATISYPQANPQGNACVSACFAPGRTVSATQMRLSARGGWLQLEGRWNPFPGCALSGWVHSASLGRDHHVEVVSEGFLYPFGTPCELILISERIFAKDRDGHYVAPLNQQAFLQISQPNNIYVGHVESPFQSISITTRRTPPLDVPASGTPATYRQYDFFLPTVNGGVPFAFEHVGKDWSGGEHRAAMPMLFVSNKARLANGLIWEPGYSWASTQANSPCSEPIQNSGDLAHTIPQTGEGLRVVDQFWALQPGRFAQYGDALISLARGTRRGDTSQKVSWIEWVRGNIPDLNPSSIATQPFRPRARTMRVSIQATGQLSGEPSASIVSYRDLRFTRTPILDPEPTTSPEAYFSNVTADRNDPDLPYVYMLETRSLVDAAGPVGPRPEDQAAADVRGIYYGVSVAQSPIPIDLFRGINNEIRFGVTQPADGIGGLAVPDTHASTLARRVGVLGDATFNERRWTGYGAVKSRLEEMQRLDFAAFSRARRSKLDVEPFDVTRSEADRAAVANAARTLMGYSSSPALALKRTSEGLVPGLKLGDLFGTDAQVLPGLRFADIFRDVALAGATSSAGEPAADPLIWNVQLTGIEWLSALLNANPADISLSDVISIIKKDTTPNRGSPPLSMGFEATLDWSNDVFKRVDVGPVVFEPDDDTTLSISAKSRVDLGVVAIPESASDIRFSPGKPHISAKAELRSFKIRVFNAIQISFSNVAFDLSAEGHKSFQVGIETVDLLPPLDFINQIASIFGGIGEDQGIHLDVSSERVAVSQTLRFPSGGDAPLFMGPAQITNLALSWAVTIPLKGRSVLAVGFGVSSREKPLTVYVPPWYGGKAYALLETTTKGCRLVEVSMEYGALVPITWGVATGQGSVTAGIFYMLQKDDANNSGSVTLRAFVKASANLSVARIIQFAGLIYIALTSQQGSGGDVLSGVVTVSVSIKIGFFRVSYSFSASHEERRQGSSNRALALGAPRLGHLLSADEERSLAESRPRIGKRSTEYLLPFAPATFSAAHRAAFKRVVSGYR